ncbi:MAG: NYN domain-containing protein [Opitutales bacterium]|nr:NYN domain-containing protein [Opitutales bacterium]
MTAGQRHLLVDGYNVLHQWPRGKAFLRRGQLAAARDYLAAEVRVLHDREGLRVTLVFDGKGEKVELERPYEDLTFSFLYSPSGLSADAVIEQLVSGAGDPSQCLVITQDSLERETLQVAGATVMSPEDLAAWVRQAEGRLAGELQKRRQESHEWWRDIK